MSIKTAPGFVECRNCAHFARMNAPHGSPQGQGHCLLHVGEEKTHGGLAAYQLVDASMPDGYDQQNPWSPQPKRGQVGGCFAGVPHDWTQPL